MINARRQLPYEEHDFRRLRRKRSWQAAFKAALEFMAGMGAIASMCDMAGILGLQLVAGTLFSMGTLVFALVIAVAIIGGGLWAAKKMREYRRELKKEENLMDHCNALQVKINNLNMLNPDQIINDQPAIMMIEPKEKLSLGRLVKKTGNRLMSFISGASNPLGIAALVIGALSISTLLATMAGLLVLAGIVIGSIMVGIATIYMDYYLGRKYEERMDFLENQVSQLQKQKRSLKWKRKSDQYEKIINELTGGRHDPHIESTVSENIEEIEYKENGAMLSKI